MAISTDESNNFGNVSFVTKLFIKIFCNSVLNIKILFTHVHLKFKIMDNEKH